MSIGDLLIFAIIGFLAYKLFRLKRSSDSEGDSGEYQLTETQKRWREKRAMDQLEQNQRDNLEQSTVISKQNQYILDNIRPFTVSEWLAWSVQPELFQAYFITVVVMFLVITLAPMIMGFPPIWWVVLPFVTFYDVKLYGKMRILEVTLWNPEWHKIFGNE